MIIQKNSEVAKEIGFEKARSFSIQNDDSSKVFRLLSTSTYKNSEFSIVREITSNMYDAMVAAEKSTEPIFVEYDKDNNRIYFKDNGIGMSPEVIDQVYLRLGKSTKSERADMIGGFGIGRFSVHSYTDTYYLDTVVDGLLYQYIIGKDEDGLPDLDMLTEEPIPTTQSNGTTVWFDLKTKYDYSVFKNGVMQQLKYFRTVYTKGFDLSNDYKLIQGEHFIFRPDRTNVSGGLEICWGNIYYPIDWEALGVRKININCALFFPTETPFQPTASREALENKPHILQLIKDKIELMREELVALWKPQQKLQSFFKWLEYTSKYVTFDEDKLDVSSFVTERYIYEPLMNTHIDPILFKENYTELFSKYFEIATRRGYRMSDIIPNLSKGKSEYYHTYVPVSTHKLSRINSRWTATIRKKLPFEFKPSLYLASKFYDQKLIPSFIAEGETKLQLPHINYRKEMIDLMESIWPEIRKGTTNLDVLKAVTAPRVVARVSNAEIRGLFNTDYSQIKKVSDLVAGKYLWIVYTNDKEVFRAIRYTPLHTKVKSKLMVILCTPKYNQQLIDIGALTVEQFAEQPVIEKLYLKNLRNDIRTELNINILSQYRALHRSLVSKYDFISKYRNVPYQTSLPSVISNLLHDKMRPHVEAENALFNQYSAILNKLQAEYSKAGNTKEGLRYKLLYESLKKKSACRLKSSKEEIILP